MVVKCGIVGQSNSILKNGFASHLATRPDIEIVKYGRVGSSSAILGPFFVRPGFAKGLDYCIIDLTMFDHTVQSVEPKKYTGYEISRIFDYLIHTIRADGCQPVILIFLPQWADLKHTWLSNLHLQIAERTRCYYFDFRNFSGTLLREGAQLSGLYTDTNHPTSECQAAIADVLAEFMRSNKLNCNRAIVRCATPDFDVINVEDQPGSCSLVLRQTSIQSWKFSVVTPGDELSLETTPGSTLRGLVINSSECTAKIQVDADPILVKDLRLAQEEDSEKFRMQIAPVFADIRDKFGRFRIKLADANAVPTERHITGPRISRSGHESKVEISALVVERGAKVFEYECWIPAFGEMDIVLRYLGGK